MDAGTLQVVALVGAGLGLASHLGYFIHGEHHMNGFQLLLSAMVAPAVLFVTVSKLSEGNSSLVAGQITAVACSTYLGALFTSILIYRAFFHRLRNFPGPFKLRLSKMFHTARIVKENRNHILLEQLHGQYGDFVRTGPNELTTICPDAVEIVLGRGSKCTKSPWYECAIYPNVSVHMTRSKALHDKRRRIWDRAFTTKALKDYEGRIRGYADQLVSGLKNMAGESVNAALWFNFFSFDIMGDMAFGKPFEMLKSGKKHPIVKLLQDGMQPLGLITPIPWLLPMLMNIPGLNGGPKKFQAYNAQQVAERKKYIPESPDLFSWLIDAEKQSNDPIHKDPRWLVGDCTLVVVAGSDTTAATLTHLFYHLVKEPKVFAKLRSELDAFYEPGSENEFKDLQHASYLNGAINETLRLHPPVPSGLQRITPPEGITVGSTHVPGGVCISTPFYVIGRLDSCYKRATEFLPERWDEGSDLVLNKSVFAPFGSGPYGCVGKQLALMEVRNVTARIVTEMDVKFAPGEDGSTLLNLSKDTFTMDLMPLKLRFEKRKK